MGGAKKILIVDDDNDIVHHSATFLRRRGYDMAVALSGEEGLRKAREWKPDLVLLDLILQDSCGSDVAADILEDEALKNTKIVFISGQVVGEGDEDVKMSAGHYVLKKPCNPELVLKIVVELIGKANQKF